MEKGGEEMVNFGTSIIVPSVQELAKEPITNILQVIVIINTVIDLEKLLHDESMDSEWQIFILLAKSGGSSSLLRLGRDFVWVGFDCALNGLWLDLVVVVVLVDVGSCGSNIVVGGLWVEGQGQRWDGLVRGLAQVWLC
ncbi:Guanylate kinase [Bienertia sinuspersici]